MKRVLVQLTDDQVAAIAREGKATGRSVAGVVRGLIDEWIARDDLDARWERALAAIGGAHSGVGDISERHDEYLDEAAES